MAFRNWLAGLALVLPVFVSAQSAVPVFTQVQELTDAIAVDDVAWADINGDGRVDLTISGSKFVTQQVFETRVYLQLANHQFVLARDFIRNYANGHPDWADFDHDGDLDLGVGGCPLQPAQGCGNWMQKQTDGVMQAATPIAPAALSFNDDFAWKDVDGDGNLDATAALSGANMQVLYGDGAGQFTDAGLVLPNIFGSGSVLFGDFDRDGDLDIFRSGYDATFGATDTPGYFRNQGRGAFVRTQSFPLSYASGTTNFESSSDIDCDGDMDINLWFGWNSDPNQFHWLENNGTGQFTDHPTTGNLGDISAGNATVLDYDRDGFKDYVNFSFVPCSLSEFGCPKTTMFRHLGFGAYQKIVIPNVFHPDFALAMYSARDFDGDGDDDLFVAGQERDDTGKYQPFRMVLYRNDTPRAPVACRLGVIGPAQFKAAPVASPKHHALLALLMALFGGAVLWGRR
jgi:hypothetical protein